MGASSLLFVFSIVWASSMIVGYSKMARNGSSTCKASRSENSTCVASRECPPNSKKLSCLPTASRPKLAAQIRATVSSVGVLGATNAAARSGRVSSGAGRARRFTFPFGVKGISSSSMKTAGSMYSGSFSFRQARNSVLVGV